MIQRSYDAPLVTVLMPVYDAQPYLAEAVESVRGQTLESWELLAVDDGSRDGSVEVLRGYAAVDPRIRVLINKENQGVVAALNRGLDEAKGRLIARMDADDRSLPRRLEVQVERFVGDESLGVCGSHLQLFGRGADAVWRYPARDDELKCLLPFRSPLPHAATVIRRHVLARHSVRYDASFLHAEDYALWSQLAQVTRFGVVPKVLYEYRRHGNNVSVRGAARREESLRRIRAERLVELGLEPSSERIQILALLGKAPDVVGEAALRRADALGRELIQANERVGWYPRRTFEKVLAEAWYGLCVAHARRSFRASEIFLRSSLSSFFPNGRRRAATLVAYWVAWRPGVSGVRGLLSRGLRVKR